MTGKSIWERRRQLDKDRREFIYTAMIKFDKAHREKMRALQYECAAAGHNWKFTNLGPLGNPWFSCTMCHAISRETNTDT